VGEREGGGKRRSNRKARAGLGKLTNNLEKLLTVV